MKSTRLGMFVLLLAPVLVAGCGGGGTSSCGTCGGGGGNPTTVTFKVSGATPANVATQTGTGGFTSAPFSGSDLTLSVPYGTSNFAVAYACPAETTTVAGVQYSAVAENVLEASTEDGTSFNMTCAQAVLAGNSGVLTGSVDASAISGANYVGVTAGNGGISQGYLLSGTSANFSESEPAGSDRVTVEAYDYAADNQFGANSRWTLAAVRNFTGVTVPGAVNQGNTVTLGAADAVTMQPITYKNVPGGYTAPTTLATYAWGGGGGMLLSNELTTQFPEMPAAAAESGDFYYFESNTQSSIGLAAQAISVETWTASGGPLTVDFPSAWTYTGPMPAAWPTFTMAYSGFTGSSNGYLGAGLDWQATKTENVTLLVLATGNHQGGSTTLAVPDLSALTGFASAAASGTMVTWSAEIGQSTFPIYGASPTTSGTASIVSSVGQYTAP